MVKKALSLILALVMVLGSLGVAFADGEATPANPTETPAAPAAAEVAAPAADNVKVKWLQENGYLKGYADGSLGLDKTITRAEFATILVRGMGMEDEAMKAQAIPSKFVDMGGHWANGYVEVAVGNGLVKGYPNNTFRPNAQITYSEVVAMLVRATKSISAVEEMTAVWPNTYIVKAAQAGILENALIGDYNTAAVREKAFELVYNAVNNANLKAFGNNSVVKAIVLENDRVESIGKKEIVVEYMKVLQESDYVTTVRKSGDIIGKQEKFTLDEKVGDVEELLGKVVDFTIDRSGKLINATVDKSYQYLMGFCEASERQLKIDNKTYTVEQQEQYNKREDRLYRTYFNGDDMKYKDFYQLNRDKKSFECEFARITIKNGKVVFIDAYDFEDIAPVREVKNSGSDVYFYNDQRDGKVDRYTPGKFVITYTEKYGFKRDEKANIKADDVIHIFKNGVIVKQDAKVEDKFTKSYADKYGEYVVLGSGDSEVEAWLNDKPFASVYSYERKEYRTLTGRAALEAIRKQDKKDVKALIAIDGSLQLIDTDIKLQGGVAGINSILSRGEVRFLPSKGDKYTGAETYDTAYYLKKGSLNRRLLSGFDVNDLVFAAIKSNDKSADELEAMFLLESEDEKAAAGTKGYKNQFRKAVVDNRYIDLKDDNGGDYKHYRYMDNNINVFGWTEKDGLFQVDFSRLIRNEKDNKELKAFVLSDAQVREIVEVSNKWDLYHFISKDDTMANTVVFTNLTTAPDAEYRYAEVVRKDNVTNVIKVQYANNRDYKNAKDEIVRTQEIDVTKNMMAGVEIGDIVALGLDKESLKEKDGKLPKAASINVVIKANQEALTIDKVDYGTSITFVGDSKTYFTRLADEFGDSRYNYAQKYINPKDKWGEYITVIRYKSRGGSAPVDKNIITYINKAEKTITVDGSRAYVLDEYVELTKNNMLYKGYTAAVEQLAIGDQIDELKQDNKGVVYRLKVGKATTPPAPQPELSAEAKAFIAKVSSVEPKVTSALTMNTLDALKAVRTELEAIRADYNKLPAAQQAFKEVKDAEAALKAMEDKVAEAIKKLEPAPAISATITKKTALGVSQCTIVLTGAVAKDVDPASIKGEKKDGSSWKPEVDAAALAANATDTFVVMTADALEAGDKLIFKVGAETVVAELK